MLFDTSTQGNLLANVGTGRAGENQLGRIVLDGGNLGTRGRGADVDHDDLVLGELGHPRLLAVSSPDTKEALEEVKVDLDFAVNLGQAALETEDEADETIGTAKCGVDAGTNTDETTGHGVLELVELGIEGDDAAEDGRALEGALLITRDDAGTDLNFVAELEDTVQNGTAGNATLELVNLGTRLVDVERSDDDHVGVEGEVADGNGNGVDDGREGGVDVELELGGNGDYRGFASDGSSDELKNGLVMLLGSFRPHQVDLVLQDDDLVQLHNLDGRKMLRGLRLGASFIAGD